ncbi:MAG: serine/threonine protein kinase [Candidatus Krumholzibacteriota bacterium]|nr:serine/threonine protein kinase [Candidatus Krumholzibacteriota bacterium]
MKSVHDLEGKSVDEFRIKKKIYSTNYSVVYIAEDTSLGNRQVALKFAKPDINLPNFVKDAEFLGELSDNPHIVPVYKVVPRGINDLDSADYIYFVMKYVSGSLEKELANGRTIPLARTWKILRGICDGLYYAHNHPKKIVHRDIKPANILLDPDDHVYICDFGLARFQETDTTKTIGLKGTLGYLSPEQAEGRELDHRSDIYSLGALLYEMLGGTIPFSKTSKGSILTAILTETPIRLDTLKKEIPVEIANVIDKCLQKDREDRYSDVRKMLEAFRAALIETGHMGREEDSMKKILPPRLSPTRKKTVRFVLTVVPLVALVLLGHFFLLQPAAVSIETANARDITVTLDNILWKSRRQADSNRRPFEFSRVLLGKRKLLVEADGFSPLESFVDISAGGDNAFTFELRPMIFPLVLITIPPEAFNPNSFKPAETVIDSFRLYYTGGDTIRAALPAGRYQFHLDHEDYAGASFEIRIEQDGLQLRNISPGETGPARTLPLDRPVRLELEPEIGYLQVSFFDRRYQGGERSNVPLQDTGDCGVKITPGAGLSPREEEYLGKRYFSHLNLDKDIPVPTAVGSLTFSKPGREDVVRPIEVQARRTKNISIYFEREKKFGSVSFIANIPSCGASGVSGLRVYLSETHPESQGTFVNPLPSGAKTPLESMQLETGRYAASFYALGWYNEKTFTLREGENLRVACDLQKRYADATIFVEGMVCQSTLRRTGPYCPQEEIITVQLPLIKERRFQRGDYEINLLNHLGEAFFTGNITIKCDTTISIDTSPHQ